MGFQPGNMSYVESFGASPNLVAFPHIEERDPSSSDTNYPLAKRWTNTLEDKVWELTHFTSSGGVLLANWELLNGGGGGGPLTFNTDVNSPANPVADELNVLGGNTEDNDILGIRSDGSSGLNTLTVQLTNRLTGDGTTVGASTINLITFPTTPPLADGTYFLDFIIVGYDVTDLTIGASYQVQCTITSDGGTLTLNGTPTREMVGDGTIFNVNLIDVQPGVGIIQLQVTGVALKTINWVGILTYTFGGA